MMVDLEYHFEERRIVFIVDSRTYYDNVDAFDKFLETTNPTILQELVTKYHPELVNNIVAGLTFDQVRACYLITVLHPTFRPIPSGEECELVKL